MYRPYNERFNHEADFKVKYKFRSLDEGGRTQLPYQGIRCDFSIKGEDHHVLYMIWPEFEDLEGELILDDNNPVSESGIARMWIVNKEMRSVHIDKIQIGTQGFFREGGRITADCEVIEMVGLFMNPSS